MRAGAITLSIDSCLDHVFLVGVAVRGIARDVGLDAQRADEVELAVVEAVNNAVEHAYDNRPGYRVELLVSAAGHRLTIEIVDRGSTLAWDAAYAAAAERVLADPLADGGRGLLIIRELMDEVGYCREGERNVLRLTKWIADGAPS